MQIILKESYLINVTYLQVTGRASCGREIIVMTACRCNLYSGEQLCINASMTVGDISTKSCNLRYFTY